jgi:hypothetical protein
MIDPLRPHNPRTYVCNLRRSLICAKVDFVFCVAIGTVFPFSGTCSSVIVRAQDLPQSNKKPGKSWATPYCLRRFLVHFSGTTIGMDFSTRRGHDGLTPRHRASSSPRYKSQALPSIFNIRTTPTSHNPKHSSDFSSSTYLYHKWILLPPSSSPKSTKL